MRELSASYHGWRIMFSEYYKKAVSRLGHMEERRFIDEAIKRLGEDWGNRNVFVLEAPTGYGKSTVTATLSLWALNEGGKLIASFPLRALLEQQYNKLVGLVREADLIGKRYMHERDSPYLVKPVTLTTIDTLSMTMFGLAPEDLNVVLRKMDPRSGSLTSSAGHYLFSWSSVILSDIILDEAHLLADETKSLNFLIALIKHVVSNKQHLVLMSATLPTRLRRVIESMLGNEACWLEYEDPEFDSKRLQKSYSTNILSITNSRKYEEILSYLDNSREQGYERALIVLNTVREAMSLYRLYKEMYGGSDVILLHSRFTTQDKEKKIHDLERLRGQKRYVVISTQTIEAGVDISSDILITELAPANSLVQRYGRFLRYQEDEGVAYIWFDETLNQDGNFYKVYRKELCLRTLDFLQKAAGKISMHVPTGERGYKQLLDYVYDEDSFDIDRRKVNEMLLIYTNFGDISQAVKLFLDLEGSFTGKTPLVPVTLIGERMQIPIGFDVFWRYLVNKGRVNDILLGDGGERVGGGDLSKVTGELKNIRYVKDLILYIVKNDVYAFEINASYEPEVGLSLDYVGDGDE